MSESPPAQNPLDALNFLLGHWVAVSPPGEPQGTFSFTSELQGHAILRTNLSESPSGRHEDLMVIHAGGQGFGADYYDSEGHVIRYTGEVRDGNRAIFTCPATESSPGYRLGYILMRDGTLNGSFEFAQPGQGVTFIPHLVWRATKRPEAIA